MKQVKNKGVVQELAGKYRNRVSGRLVTTSQLKTLKALLMLEAIINAKK